MSLSHREAAIPILQHAIDLLRLPCKQLDNHLVIKVVGCLKALHCLEGFSAA